MTNQETGLVGDERSLLTRRITTSINQSINSYSYQPNYFFIAKEKMIPSWTRATKVESSFIDNYGVPIGTELEVERRHSNGYQHDSEIIYDINKTAMLHHYIARHGEFSNDITEGEERQLVQLWNAKEDGSLSNGIEFVSQPMTLDMWQSIPLTFENYTGDYAGYHRRSTGFHTHMPKGAFTDTQLFLWFHLMETLGSAKVEHQRYRTFLNVVGQREFNSWARFEMPEYSSSVKSKHAQTAIERVNNGGGRYKFINLQPRATIELRFFNANMKSERLLKNVEFVDSTYMFTKYMDEDPLCGLVEALQVDSYYEYIKSLPDRYPNLLEYLSTYERRFTSDMWELREVDEFEYEAYHNLLNDRDIDADRRLTTEIGRY